MITKEESLSISLIRSISVLLIFTCHILQAYNNFLAWWFNVAVQIFVTVSGYLFGRKEITNKKSWYKSRFLRVLKPYYILVFVIFVLVFALQRDLFSITSIICYAFSLQGLFLSLKINSLAHLWYITLICICYLITPLLQKMKFITNAKRPWMLYVYMIAVCFVLQIAFYRFVQDLIFTGIAIYLFAFFIGKRTSGSTKHLKYSLLAALVVLIPIQVYFQNFYHGATTTLIKLINYSFPWIHAIAGIAIFLFLKDLFNRIKKIKPFWSKVINTLDTYSYEIYLVHHIFILGVFSLAFLTNIIAVNILIIVALTAIGAFILKKLSLIRILRPTVKK